MGIPAQGSSGLRRYRKSELSIDGKAEGYHHYGSATLHSYKTIVHFFILFLLVGICYSNTLHQEWHFDDFPNIVYDQNIHWKELNFSNIFESLVQDSEGQQRIARPLPRLTFGINYYLTGLNTLSYHVFNILIHAITACMVYLVFGQILTILRISGDTKFNKTVCQDIALLAAAFWAIHPLQVMAVTYIVQRMTAMATLFYVTAIFLYLKIRLNPGTITKMIKYLVITVIFWCFAIFSKENAVLFPLSLIIIEVIFFPITRKKIFTFIIFLLLFLIITIIFFLLSRGESGDLQSSLQVYSFITKNIVNSYEPRTFTLVERLLTEPRVLIQYLFFVVYPVSNFLSMESDLIVSTGLFSPWTTIASIVGLIGLIALSIFFLKKNKLLALAILFFLANHLVESSVIALEIYFEHRNYLPSIFVYLCMAYGLIFLLNWFSENERIVIVRMIIFLIVCLVISAGNATYIRNDAWATEETLCLDNIEKAPNNVRPMISIASYYMRHQKLDKAYRFLVDAENILNSGQVKIQKDWIAMLYHNAGSVFYQKNEYKKAIELLLKSIEYNKYSWETHTLLGLLFFKEGNVQESVKAYTNAIQIGVQDSEIYNMYGRALYAKGNVDLAIEVFREGLSKFAGADNLSEIRLNLVACYIKLKNFEKARSILNEANFKSDDIVYFLYKGVLNPEKASQISKDIAEILLLRKEEFCNWLNSVKENRFPGIIYPQIDATLEDILRTGYRAKLTEMVKTFTITLEASKNCVTPKVIE